MKERLLYSDGQTVHHRSWCTLEKLCTGWNEDFTALWNEAMEDAHLREKERKV